ncbi:tRNA lysidine(34) synthetase TilS [Aquabacter cavernae]|uniref:tRNA lysidine(34) synthetase TilS n=1 Tax=Aquabacter cavernae TaxID=2496029 RepID=UPI000F8EFC45|nr:tRNA lysidine(34) synthetase TilS [Aquabacter cavernae]
MPAADPHPDFAAAELQGLFAPFETHDHVLIALSGGPDSTALLLLAQDWLMARGEGPLLSAATVDHGLRPAARVEAEAAGAVCARLGVPHAILDWVGDKPKSGIQEAARIARYDLLLAHARAVGAGALAVAHTLDDQAETILFRLACGSGPAGLAGMRPSSVRAGVTLLRPLLEVPKARLVGHLDARGIAYARDPSNLDPRHARPRLRAAAPLLAAEGLTPARLALLGRRLARAEAALSAAAVEAAARCLLERTVFRLRLDAHSLFAEPDEISLRVLVDALSAFALEKEVELAKAERLHGLMAAAVRVGEGRSGTLAGALARMDKGVLSITSAPPRGKKAALIAANSTR